MTPMKELFYDFHIHSCLSPCGDDDMSPVNIAGMAYVKGLDVIAVTDHNSCRNCGPAIKQAEEYGIICIPGMEINTIEEVHALCLFSELKDALSFDEYVYTRLLKVKNNKDLFGNQILYGDEDNIIGEEENLLINATDIPFDRLYDLVEEYKGVMIPAHIDKEVNSLIKNLGFIPGNSRFKTAEVKDLSKLHQLMESDTYLKGCRIINDSDAHTLGHIKEPEHTIQVTERTRASVLEALKEGI